MEETDNQLMCFKDDEGRRRENKKEKKPTKVKGLALLCLVQRLQRSSLARAPLIQLITLQSDRPSVFLFLLPCAWYRQTCVERQREMGQGCIELLGKTPPQHRMGRDGPRPLNTSNEIFTWLAGLRRG